MAIIRSINLEVETAALLLLCCLFACLFFLQFLSKCEALITSCIGYTGYFCLHTCRGSDVFVICSDELCKRWMCYVLLFCLCDCVVTFVCCVGFFPLSCV
jgi:hypothetical protein